MLPRRVPLLSECLHVLGKFVEVRLESIPTRKNAVQITIFVVLIFIDAATKISAYLLLPHGKSLLPTAPIQFALRINTLGLGSAAQKMISFGHGLDIFLFTSLFDFCLAAILVVLFYYRKLSFGIGILYAFLLLLVVLIASYLLPRFDITNIYELALTLRISQCLLWIVIWKVVSPSLWKWGLLFWASAAAGNLLSFFYPPYGVIDFLWSEPIHQIVGFGIFNLADVFWLVGFFFLVLAIMWSVISKLKNSMRSSVVKGN